MMHWRTVTFDKYLPAAVFMADQWLSGQFFHSSIHRQIVRLLLIASDLLTWKNWDRAKCTLF